MTTMIPLEAECSLCGARSEQHLVTGAATQGLPDLDTRQAEPVRSTIAYWVQRCPNCGYCATDISLDYPLADQVLRSAAYEKILHKRSMPEKARQFLAWALILELNEESGGAGWASVHAAWVCEMRKKQRLPWNAASWPWSALPASAPAWDTSPGLKTPASRNWCWPICAGVPLNGMPRCAGSKSGLARTPSLMVVRALRMEREMAHTKDLAAHSVEELLDKTNYR